MAFGSSSANQNRYPPGTQFYYVTIKQKEGGAFLPAPVFKIQQKTDDKTYVNVGENVKFLSGNLIEIRNKTGKTKEGKEILSVTATLQDGKDIYFTTLYHDMLGWNIMNSYLALKHYNGIEHSLYQSKPKEPGGKTFGSVATFQDGQMVKGKFDNKELPEIPKIKVGKDVHSDKTKRTEFFIAQIEELSKVLKANAPAQGTTSNASNARDTGVDLGDTGDDAGPEVPDNDVPF